MRKYCAYKFNKNSHCMPKTEQNRKKQGNGGLKGMN